jgi:hypothetical protein
MTVHFPGLVESGWIKLVYEPTSPLLVTWYESISPLLVTWYEPTSPLLVTWCGHTNAYHMWVKCQLSYKTGWQLLESWTACIIYLIFVTQKLSDMTTHSVLMVLLVTRHFIGLMSHIVTNMRLRQCYM